MLGRKWSPTSVRILVAREAPELVPNRPRRGARSAAGFALNGLLRCPEPCGGLLTGTTSHAGKYVRYHCHRADGDRSHPRPTSVSADEIMPWIKAEATLLRVPGDSLKWAEESAGKLAEFDVQRERVIDQFVDGTIRDKAGRDRRLAAIEAERAKVVDKMLATAIPAAVDWSWPPAQVNTVLRALWSEVTLGPDLRPVAATWTVPELRARSRTRSSAKSSRPMPRGRMSLTSGSSTALTADLGLPCTRSSRRTLSTSARTSGPGMCASRTATMGSQDAAHLGSPFTWT